MDAQTAVINSQGLFNVHTAYYASPAPRGTIILVNGSLATTTAFAQTLRFLQSDFNVVLFDQPYAGQSKAHNRHDQPLSAEQEAHLLLDLITHFQADHLLSFSWGGASALLALAQNPPSLRKAVIMGFSPVVNPAMRAYLESGMQVLSQCDRRGVAELVNNTIGKHLPSLYKRFNFRHICSLDEHEYLQMAAHVRQVLSLDSHCYLQDAECIDIPMLFVNGELDEYTSANDALQFRRLIDNCEFARIANAGHFLDAENKHAWEQTRDAVMGFLLPAERTVKASTFQGRHQTLLGGTIEPSPALLASP
ncbi:alpha/beta fold hydrolase [Halopseudomonas pelagia]|uniref:alpha/beta fold hydrolase n=1 Tax=Halopseudomonas pelagia TaxID=553151 RepID=UPI0003A2878F|nr:alpha/beta hydrolase [Halopseudomonas pelagia]|tara:strand:+ start:394 stop:1314 length:921 start_codon:yes stop_codon:yes gene_type:complete